MQVYKFGGASINSIDRIKLVGNIIGQYKGDGLMVVVSAMGKTTNVLEKVAEAFFAGRKDAAIQLFHVVKEQHLTTAKYLLLQNYLPCEAQLNDFFTEVEWLLHDKPVREFDYYYDQIVCIGELLSTTIVSHFLTEEKIVNTWLDVRDLVRTDNNFRDANIDWAVTEKQVRKRMVDDSWQLAGKKMMDNSRPLADVQDSEAVQNEAPPTTIHQPPTIFITQGFVGVTDENESTTLGREGSDYSAAIFANILHAESLTIWKDVESVMNADPKLFPNAVPIHELNYAEVIEMAYFGAQIIHPKTIKPLFLKGIPFYVKCFLNASLPGTLIHNKPVKNLPPIVMMKNNQVLLRFKCNDYSFVEEKRVSELYRLFQEIGIKPNLTQNAAISFVCCVDDWEEKIQKLAFAAADLFDINIEKGLEMITVRHYTEDMLVALTADKEVVLEQKNKETYQVLVRQ